MEHNFHFSTFILIMPLLDLKSGINLDEIMNLFDVPDEATLIDVYVMLLLTLINYKLIGSLRARMLA